MQGPDSNILKFMMDFYPSVKALCADRDRTAGIWFDTGDNNRLDSLQFFILATRLRNDSNLKRKEETHGF
jgi:hypothetical protein